MHRKRNIVFHVITSTMIGVSILVGFLCFLGVFYRTWEAVRDIGLSVAYFFTHIFGLDVIVPTVTTLPRDFAAWLPETWENFIPKTMRFFELFISFENFMYYLDDVFYIVRAVALFLSSLLPFVIACVFACLVFLSSKNTDHGKKSKALQRYLVFRKKVLFKIRNTVKAYIGFLKRYKFYGITFCCVWAYFFNFGTIVIEFFAFVFYFSGSFDLNGIFTMIVKLISDLLPMIRFIPSFLWTVIGLIAVDRFRRWRGFKKLRKYEERNRDFIADRPVVTMLVGSMRTKKTTIITDMQLSLQEMFRDSALDDMRDIQMKFRRFPWREFEAFLKRNILNRKLPTLASINVLFGMFIEVSKSGDIVLQRSFRRWARSRFGYRYNDLNFGYDGSYPLQYDNGMAFEDLLVLLREYAKLYSIYIEPTMIVGNYAVRSDKSMEDRGNLPMWKGDFFKVPAATRKKSEMSHVLNFNMLRLGKLVGGNTLDKDALSGGTVLGATEIAKERGNQNDLKGLSKGGAANQVNDLFNTNLKMIGHSATVYFKSYVKMFTDDQRPESWGADARELCDIVEIEDGGKKKIILPFFALGEALYLLSDKIYRAFFDKYDFNRGDSNLLIYAMIGLHGLIYDHYKRIENTFSVANASLNVQRGTQDGKQKKCKYYLSTKKIYADRFSTDCFSAFYTNKSARSSMGIRDIPQYKELKPSMEELNSQNSYFVEGITKAFSGDAEALFDKKK